DPGHVDLRLPGDGGVGFGRDFSLLDQGFGGQKFHLEHLVETILVGPEFGHLGSAVAVNHNDSQNSLKVFGYNACSCSKTRAAKVSTVSFGNTGTFACARTGP